MNIAFLTAIWYMYVCVCITPTPQLDTSRGDPKMTTPLPTTPILLIINKLKKIHKFVPHFMCHEVVCGGVLPVNPRDRLQLEGIVFEAGCFINEDLCRKKIARK